MVNLERRHGARRRTREGRGKREIRSGVSELVALNDQMWNGVVERGTNGAGVAGTLRSEGIPKVSESDGKASRENEQLCYDYIGAHDQQVWESSDEDAKEGRTVY